MKQFIFAFGLLTSIGSLALQAQILVAKIPFDFQVGTKAMPAGNYQIHEKSRLLTLRRSGSKPMGAVWLTSPEERKDGATSGQLVFKRYGDQYFLKTMWVPNSREGFVLPQSSQERELISRSRQVQTAGVSIQRQ